MKNEPIQYIARTRDYYRALGYSQDYVWATFSNLPFAVLSKPLSEWRVALVMTASPVDFDGVKRVWSGQASAPPPKMFTDNVAWDKEIDTHRRPSQFSPNRSCFRIGEIWRLSASRRP